MTSPEWYAAFLLLASLGCACLVYAVADFINRDWAVRYLWPLLLAGFSAAPVLAWAAWARRWWEREGARLADDRARTEALNTETKRKQAELAAQTQLDPEPEPEPDTADLPRLERQREQELAHWEVFWRRVVQAGCAMGWGRDTLTTGAYRVMTQPAWNVATNILQQAGFLYKDGAGTRLLVSEADWNAGRLWEKVPAPAGEPPDIAPPPYNSTTTRPNNGKTAAGAVVDHVARQEAGR